MKLWADWLADNPRDHARCPGLTPTVANEQRGVRGESVNSINRMGDSQGNDVIFSVGG
jgi:hypothetical protein